MNIYEELEIDLSIKDSKKILSLVDKKIQEWSKRATNPKYKAQVPLKTKALKDIKQQIEKNPSIINDHANEYAAILRKKQQSAANKLKNDAVLYVAGGVITQENLSKLAATYSMFSEIEILKLLGARVKKEKSFTYKEDNTQPLESHNIDQIAAQLDIVGKKNLFDFLGLPRESSLSDIKLKEENIRKTNEGNSNKLDPKIGANIRLCGMCVTFLFDAEKKKQYIVAIDNEVLERLKDGISTSSADKTIDSERYRNLLSFCVNGGVPKDKAEYYIYKYARENGVKIEEDDDSKQTANKTTKSTTASTSGYTSSKSNANGSAGTKSPEGDFINKHKTILIIGLIASITIAYFTFNGGSEKGDDSKSAEVQTEIPVVTPAQIYYCSALSGLTIRNAPSASGRDIGTLLFNQEIEVSGIKDGYAEIKYGGGIAYVSEKYLSKTRSVQTAPPVRGGTSGGGEKSIVTNNGDSSSKGDGKVAESDTNSGGSTTKGGSTSGGSNVIPPPAPPKAKTASELYTEGYEFMVAHKYEQGISKLEQSANMGNAEAMRYLGEVYINGSTVSKDSPKGFALVLKAAQAGNKKAMMSVAEYYISGTGTTKDKVQAKYWYQKCVDVGYEVNMAKAKLRRL